VRDDASVFNGSEIPYLTMDYYFEDKIEELIKLND
jgi:hypothetical protein